MIRQRTRSTSSLFLTSSLSRTFTSGRAGHKYGKKEGCKEYHTANQLQRRCRKKRNENIHDRFILDKFFRKTVIELGHSEEIILEMDRLASEDHSHVATQEEIDVYRGNWWIRSNFVGSDTMPIRHRPDFKKALSTLHRSRKRRIKRTLLLVVAMANFLVASHEQSQRARSAQVSTAARRLCVSSSRVTPHWLKSSLTLSSSRQHFPVLFFFIIPHAPRTCTPTCTTWTPWKKTTCATPPKRATTPTTSPSPTQKARHLHQTPKDTMNRHLESKNQQPPNS